MSFLGGVDKTASNPLKQVTGREAVDRSAHRDRFVPAASRQNVRNSRTLPSEAHAIAQPFNLSHLSHALAQTSQAAGPSQPHVSLNDQWALAARNAQLRSSSPSSSQRISIAPQQSAWAQTFSPTSASALDKGKSRAPPPPQLPPQAAYQPFVPRMVHQPFQPMYSSMPPSQLQAGLERPEQEYKDMEAAFERALADARAEDAASTQAEQVQRDEHPEEDIEEIHREAKGDFEKVWESLRPEAERLGQLAEWENEFSQFTHDEDDLYDVMNDSIQRNGGLGTDNFDDQFNLNGMDPFESHLEAEDGIPKMRAYEFSDTSGFDQVHPLDLYSQATDLDNQAIDLSTHGVMLESFIQRATSEDYTKLDTTPTAAWAALGRLHAMNEMEEKALRAFEEGRKLLPTSGGIRGDELKDAGDLLTNLAISYVNESLDLAALTTLHQYLSYAHRGRAGSKPSRTAADRATSPWSQHQELRDRYLAAAQAEYQTTGHVNAELQVGLGVLYYMMGEYGESQNCWTAALHERPTDYLLWNRLGATLANSGSSEEAVDAYRRALDLRPGFTRAIFNLGVACLNIGVFKEAAEHFLSALKAHEADRAAGGTGSARTEGDGSIGIWLSLRRALEGMDMGPLIDQARPGTDLGVFQQAGFEF